MPEGVELVRRVGDSASYLIAINHTDRDVELTASGKELLTGAPCPGVLPLPAGEVRTVAVCRRPAAMRHLEQALNCPDASALSGAWLSVDPDLELLRNRHAFSHLWAEVRSLLPENEVVS